MFFPLQLQLTAPALTFEGPLFRYRLVSSLTLILFDVIHSWVLAQFFLHLCRARISSSLGLGLHWQGGSPAS